MHAACVVVRAAYFHGHAYQACVVFLSDGLGQVAQELVACCAVRCFVGHRPDDDAAPVLVAVHHVSQLTVRVAVGVGVIPVYGPVNGDFRPNHEAHLFGHAHHLLVMHKVAVQLLGPVQQCAAFCLVAYAALFEGCFFMNGNAPEEYFLAIEQDVFALGLDAAEADAVVQHFCAVGNAHVVEFGRFGRPKRRLGLQAEFGTTLSVGSQLLVNLQLRYAQRHLFAGMGLAQLHVALQLVVFARSQFQAIVVDRCFGRFHQKHVARDAAIVPPVRVHGRHVLGPAVVVHSSYHKVVAILHAVGDVEVERRESALVHAELLSIQVDVCQIVDGAKVQVDLGTCLTVVAEIFLVPDAALVEEQFVALRIPVARYSQLLGQAEIILHQVRRTFRLLILEESVVAFGQPVVVEAGIEGVNNRLPSAIERRDIATVNILQDKRGVVLGIKTCGRHTCESHQGADKPLFHNRYVI